MSPDPQQILASAAAAEPAGNDPVLRYEATGAGIVRLVPDKDGQLRDVLLANFNARITRAMVLDDGEENHAFFDVEITIKNRTYTIRNMPAGDFESLTWVVPATYGHGSIEPGRGTRELLRHAIQILSGDYPDETHYSHLGWRSIGGSWAYLHAGGAIGANGPVSGATVSLANALDRFQLPDLVERRAELRDAVRASMQMLRAAPERLTGPLFCAIWRAPIDASDFSIHLFGTTGTGKSVLASLAQQHYGAAMEFNVPPASWSSTANANEGLRFAAKDVLLLLDDLAPDTATRAAIDRKFRGQANGAGRDRMRPDGTLRPTKRPRGTLLSTGEDTPMNHSATARTLVLRVRSGDIDWSIVTDCQRDANAGLYSLALAGYVQWLATRLDDIRRARPAQIQALRAELADARSHRRTPGMIAELMFGLERWAEFAVEVGAITAAEVNEFVRRVIDGVIEAADTQSATQRDADPVVRFGELIRAAITAGRAHVASEDGRSPTHPEAWGWRDQKGYGVRVGWLVGEHLYLEPVNAYTVVSESATAMEIKFPGERALWSALRERGLLLTIDEAGETNKIRRVLEGKEQRVLHLSPSFITGDPERPPAEHPA